MPQVDERGRIQGVAGVDHGARAAVSDHAPGRRTRKVTLVTTLLDAEAYPADELAEVYGTRWRVEEDLRSLKQTMKMDVLKCMTVDGVLKELTMYALAYNLVARGYVRGSGPSGGDGGTGQLRGRATVAAWGQEGEDMPELVVNPSRPGRYEPRVRKPAAQAVSAHEESDGRIGKLLREKDLAASALYIMLLTDDLTLMERGGGYCAQIHRT